MKERKSAVLAAIDENWKQFRTSLDRLVSEDMSKTGVLNELAVIDIVGHVTTWEWELVNALDRKRIESITDIDEFNKNAIQNKKGRTPRQIIEDMEQIHRSLRDQLIKAPDTYFEPNEPFRAFIDSCTVLHYQEHGSQIRIWASKHSLNASNG